MTEPIKVVWDASGLHDFQYELYLRGRISDACLEKDRCDECDGRTEMANWWLLTRMKCLCTHHKAL
jgi:hypothetical protein